MTDGHFSERKFGRGAWLCAALAALTVSGAEAEPSTVRAIEGRLAVFATTNAVREAVVWLPSGSELTVRGELADEAVWVRVEPPAGAGVWIYRDLVRNGVVQANKVRVRAGAGLTFHPVGVLNKGDRVEVRSTYGDWVKIAPPPGINFWVLRDQVEPLAVQPSEELAASNAVQNIGLMIVSELTNSVASEALAAAAAAAVPLLRAPPAEIAGHPLLEGVQQGERVVLTGVLDWGVVGEVNAPFSLTVRQADGDMRPVCHILVSTTLANPLVGSTVSVVGTRWFLKSSGLPVVAAESVREVE